MSFPSFCKELLRKMGVIAIRGSHPAAKYILAPPSGIFDVVLLQVFPSIDHLRFIQIGANDGVRADPVRDKVLNHAWTGVLVEPLPSLFDQLRNNYMGSPGLEFVNAAIDTSAGTRAIHFLDPGLTVPDWAHGLATFDLAHLRITAQGLGLKDADIRHRDVPTITWKGLLATSGDKPCDVLVIDAEGYDISLLRAAPLDRWRPRVIQFEHSFATIPERLAFYAELIGFGYEIASDGPDTVAWIKPVASR